MSSFITYTLPRCNFFPLITPPQKSTLRTASLAFEKSVCSSTAFARAFALVSGLVSIPSHMKRMYLYSSLSPLDEPLLLLLLLVAPGMLLIWLLLYPEGKFVPESIEDPALEGR